MAVERFRGLVVPLLTLTAVGSIVGGVAWIYAPAGLITFGLIVLADVVHMNMHRKPRVDE